MKHMKSMGIMLSLLLLLVSPTVSVLANQADTNTSEENTQTTTEENPGDADQKKHDIVVDGDSFYSVKVSKKGRLTITAKEKFPTGITAALYESKQSETPYTYGKQESNGSFVFSMKKTGTYYLKVQAGSNTAASGQGFMLSTSLIPSETVTFVNKKWAKGYLDKSISSSVYFKAAPASNGKFTIRAKRETSIILYNSAKNKALSKKITLNKANNYTASFVVKKGTYYVRSTAKNPTIELSYSFTKIRESSSSSIKTAKSVAVGSSYRNGMIMITDTTNTADWYKFKLTRKKRVTLDIIGYTDDCKVRVQVYDSKKRPLSSGSILVGNRENIISKSPGAWHSGTYYIKITKTAAKGSAYYKFRVK